MGIVAILSFFLILFVAIFIDGGFLEHPAVLFVLLAGFGVAAIGLGGLFNFIKHDELPSTFHPRKHDPHST
jgi:hypothetical protein